jgi:Rrf2 family protein
MLKLSKKADYGLIAVRHLAMKYEAGACSSKEIARAYGIPTELLAKILQKLVKKRLLVSQHGAEGGYALARPPASVTVFEVIKAIDGPLLITSCITSHGDSCSQSSTCTVKEPLSKINEIIVQALSSVTISSLDENGSMPPTASPSLVQIESPGQHA